MATGRTASLTQRNAASRPLASRRCLGAAAVAVIFALAPSLCAAQDAPAPVPPAATAPADVAAKPGVAKIPLLLARQLRDDPLPLSLLDLPPKDLGVAGAKLGINDNNTTGRFLNQEFSLETIEDADPAKLIEEVKQKVDAGQHYVAVDVAPDTLLKLADALAGKEAIIINYGAADDSLREENCRSHVLHSAPTRTMLADALAQYLVTKRWRSWLLVYGPSEKDKLYAEALRRAAKRFGAKIVEERAYNYDPGSRRADGGFEQVQQQMSGFTQNAPDYDVLVVADEDNLFAEYLPYRTWDPRPVAGSAGLTAQSWHPAIELWGGTQFQNRFVKLADRTMRPADYNAWMAVRMVGEAASRSKSDKYADIVNYMKSPAFEVAAFKGVGLSLRNWNGQIRQPILITTPKMLVSVAPQEGFLHQYSVLDTLGIDKPETKCRAFTQ